MEPPKPKVKSFEIPKRLVYEAWEKVRANKGAPGVDTVTIWREADYNVQVTAVLRLLAFAPAGETEAVTRTSVVASPSYLVDNVKGRVALDVEWHAKDGNLDRDIAAYRALYDAGIIDGAVMITMTRADLRALALRADPATTKFGTSTTTNLTKVLPRLTRGDGGGCPILVVSICARTV